MYSFLFSQADEKLGEPPRSEFPVQDAFLLPASLLPGPERVPDLHFRGWPLLLRSQSQWYVSGCTAWIGVEGGWGANAGSLDHSEVLQVRSLWELASWLLCEHPLRYLVRECFRFNITSFLTTWGDKNKMRDSHQNLKKCIFWRSTMKYRFRGKCGSNPDTFSEINFSVLNTCTVLKTFLFQNWRHIHLLGEEMK